MQGASIMRGCRVPSYSTRAATREDSSKWHILAMKNISLWLLLYCSVAFFFFFKYNQLELVV